MKIKLFDVEKVRINIDGKLSTISPNKGLVAVEYIKKIYINNKWIKDFTIILNDNADYIVEFWTKEEIKEKLRTDNHWLFRGLVAIYNKQTLAEQANEMTEKKNDVGFSGVDAYFLTEMVKKFKNKEDFSIKQLAITRKKMLKYSGQLLKIAQKKI